MARPGVVQLTATLTLVQAIQEAGGLLATAHLIQVVLIRREADGCPVGSAIDVRHRGGSHSNHCEDFER